MTTPAIDDTTPFTQREDLPPALRPATGLRQRLTKRARIATPLNYDKDRRLPPLPSLEVYVDPTERDGLPPPIDSDARATTSFTRAATKLVRAHTRRLAREGHLSARYSSKPTKPVGPRRPSGSTTYDLDTEQAPLVAIDDRGRLGRRTGVQGEIDERTALRESGDSDLAGNSVLSTLLALYGSTAGPRRDDSDDSSYEDSADHGNYEEQPPVSKRRQRSPAEMSDSTERAGGHRRTGHERSGSEVTLTSDYSYPSSISGSTAAHEDEKGEHRKVSPEHEKRLRRKATRKLKEIFITRHVAKILHRQEFILKLTRSLMMYGAPSHRLEAQIQTTATVLDVQLSTLYLPNVMMLSFGDAVTSTCDLKIIKQTSNLNLEKLVQTHHLYWDVIHDDLSVSDACIDLDDIMRRRVLYSGWKSVLIGGLCSAAIAPVTFNASFVDSAMSFVLGALLIFVQNLSARSDLYSSVFEITIATLISFVAAALASTGKFCYTAVASSSVVLILPGYLFLSGALELASRSIISGAVRTCYAVIYSLFLGFGLSIGADLFYRTTGNDIIGAGDPFCTAAHNSLNWWQKNPPLAGVIVCVPLYSALLSLRSQAPVKTKELYATILISSLGMTANRLSSDYFKDQSGISSTIASFAIGVTGNLYGLAFHGSAFIVMVTGILFQLPSGMGTSNLLKNDVDSFRQGFAFAQGLLSTSIGLTVGLFFAAVLVYPFGRGRRGAAGLFSF